MSSLHLYNSGRDHKNVASALITDSVLGEKAGTWITDQPRKQVQEDGWTLGLVTDGDVPRLVWKFYTAKEKN